MYAYMMIYPTQMLCMQRSDTYMYIDKMKVCIRITKAPTFTALGGQMIHHKS